jgi:hypothetical protein
MAFCPFCGMPIAAGATFCGGSQAAIAATQDGPKYTWAAQDI